MDLNIKKRYINYCVGKSGIAPSSAKIYANQVDLYLRRSGKSLDNTKRLDIINYLGDLKLIMQLGQNTRRLARTAISNFYDWYSSIAGIENPSVDLEVIKSFQSCVKYINPEQLESILYRLHRRGDDWGRTACGAISLIASTGIRIHEFEKLKLGDVKRHYDKKRDRVFFTLLVNSSKTNSARLIPFGTLIEKTLSEYFVRYLLWLRHEKHQKEQQPLFFRLENKYNKLPEDQNVALKRHSIRRMLDVASDRKISAHQLRHFFATYSIIAGMSIHTLKSLMGHSSITTTEGYIHVAEIERGDALDHSPTKGIKSDPSVWGYVNFLKKISRQADAII